MNDERYELYEEEEPSVEVQISEIEVTIQAFNGSNLQRIKKLELVKVIKYVCDIGMREAKDFIDSLLHINRPKMSAIFKLPVFYNGTYLSTIEDVNDCIVEECLCNLEIKEKYPKISDWIPENSEFKF